MRGALLWLAAAAFAPAAAIAQPTVDHSFASSDGIPITDSANKAPGSDRLAQTDEPDKLVTSDGNVRVRLMLGHGIYSTSGEQLGIVRDVLLHPGAEPVLVVESNGRKVAVPWSRLRFGLSGAELRNLPVLPGISQHALEELPEINFAGANGPG